MTVARTRTGRRPSARATRTERAPIERGSTSWVKQTTSVPSAGMPARGAAVFSTPNGAAG